MSLKIIVCGGRDYSDKVFLFDALDHILEKHPDFFLVSGNARGADTLAIEWAIARKAPYRGFPAKWKIHGKSAGYKRNQEMLDYIDPDKNGDGGVIAFSGGRGTAMMVDIALRQNVPVWDLR